MGQVIELQPENRKDFLAIDNNSAISAEGVVFHVGEKVFHEGDEDGKEGTITGFTVNSDTSDIIANTEHGGGRICFLYHK